MNADLEKKMHEEHYQKYEALARKIGVDALLCILPVSGVRIQQAFDQGDEHLNTIPLHLWDRAVGAIGPVAVRGDIRLSFNPPFTPAVANHLSLAERVCVLKHVARYYTK